MEACTCCITGEEHWSCWRFAPSVKTLLLFVLGETITQGCLLQTQHWKMAKVRGSQSLAFLAYMVKTHMTLRAPGELPLPKERGTGESGDKERRLEKEAGIKTVRNLKAIHGNLSFCHKHWGTIKDVLKCVSKIPGFICMTWTVFLGPLPSPSPTPAHLYSSWKNCRIL